MRIGSNRINLMAVLAVLLMTGCFYLAITDVPSRDYGLLIAYGFSAIVAAVLSTRAE